MLNILITALTLGLLTRAWTIKYENLPFSQFFVIFWHFYILRYLYSGDRFRIYSILRQQNNLQTHSVYFRNIKFVKNIFIILELLKSSENMFSVDLGLQPATLLRKRLRHRCFHVNFAKFLRTLFLQNTSALYFFYKFF